MATACWDPERYASYSWAVTRAGPSKCFAHNPALVSEPRHRSRALAACTARVASRQPESRRDEGSTSWYLMLPRRTTCWHRSLSRGAHPAGSEGETTGSPRALTLLCMNSPTPPPRARTVAHRPAVFTYISTLQEQAAVNRRPHRLQPPDSGGCRASRPTSVVVAPLTDNLCPQTAHFLGCPGV